MAGIGALLRDDRRMEMVTKATRRPAYRAAVRGASV
jgi:hypothetical protein